MRVALAASLLSLLPAAFAAEPASAQTKRGSVYLSLMGEPFVASPGQSPLGSWVAGADVDKNGMVSLAELTIDADRFFKKLDVDGDGRIGGEEMTRYEQQIAPAGLRAAAGARPVGADLPNVASETYGEAASRGAPRAGRDGLPGGMQGPQTSYGSGGQRSEYSGLNSIPQPVAMTDVDMSGSVTAEEFARAAARRFLTHDLDKNGLLDAGELAGSKRRGR